MEPIYTAEAVLTAPVHNEFNISYLHTRKYRTVLHFLYILFLILLVTLSDSPKNQYFVIFFAVFFWIEVILNNRKGGNIQYKRTIAANNGKPFSQSYQFYEDRVDCHNLYTNADVTYQYDKFLSLIETKNLLVLLMNYRLCLVIEKSKVAGGSPDELTNFLLDHCARIKPRKVKKVNFGKWVHRVLLVVAAICFLLAILNLAGLHMPDLLSGRLHNNMSYQEMASELEPLGITIEELETFDREYAEEYGVDYYRDNPYASKIIDLLYWEGSGITDPETYQWTPSRSGIYWSDMEVMNVDTMYTDLLTGIAAMDRELEISGICEDYGSVNMEYGTGTVSVTFALNGRQAQLSANFDYDWLDIDVLREIGQLLTEDDLDKDLYFAFDEGQGFYLYYGHHANVGSLNRKTGLDFQILNRNSRLY